MADFSERIASAGERDAWVLDVDNLADAMHGIVPGSDDGELQSMALKINDIIQDECQLHKKILIPRLYTKIRRRTGLQSTATLQIIEYLEKNHLIKDNSTLLKSTLMENGRRKYIFQEISRFPGIYFNLLKSRTGSGSKVLEHHVSILSEFGYIFDENMNGKRCFFPATASKDDTWFHYFLQLDNTRKIIDVLLQSGGDRLELQEVSRRSGMAYPLVAYHTTKLLNKNVVVFQETVERRVYGLSREFAAFVKRMEDLVA
jgi:predicted transcriptional regulator